MRTVKLTYEIERKDKFFLIYIKDTKYLESLEIPINVTDELYSLSLTVSDYSNVGEQLCIKLRDTFLRIWNYSYGIPQIVFTGDTSKLKDEYKNAPVFIFFTGVTIIASKSHSLCSLSLYSVDQLKLF